MHNFDGLQDINLTKDDDENKAIQKPTASQGQSLPGYNTNFSIEPQTAATFVPFGGDSTLEEPIGRTLVGCS